MSVTAGDVSDISKTAEAMEIMDVDGDGSIGFFDFIYFAGRLKELYLTNEREYPAEC